MKSLQRPRAPYLRSRPAALLRRGALLVGPAILLAAPAAAQGGVPYSPTASWESYKTGVTTGGAFADIDGDGHLDMVVANGNDILRQRVEVYTNDGAGNYPTNPQWQSSDVDYHGHLAVGDVNGDGRPDVAVSVFLGAGGFGDKGRAKLYLNQSGTLASTPSWSSSDTFYSFSCDLGDADSDGDLDLAVATGEPYYGSPDQNRIYYNTGGVLATTPGWTTAAADHSLDVAFGDADGDGDLDLAFATAKGPTRVFFQGPGGMSTTPGFVATDNNNQNGNSATWADTDGDGYLELAITDNNQLAGGTGNFKIYDNVLGTLQTTPYWSDWGGYVSAAALADLNLDGRPEFAGGIWWGGVWIYVNNGGSYPSAPAWESAKNSVAEAVFFGDVDEAALHAVGGEVHAPNGRRTYYLEHAPVHALAEVAVDGVVLTPAQYAADLEDGWIALDRTPVLGVTVDYTYSTSLDLGLTNWDQSVGNLVFERYTVPVATFRNDAGATNPSVYVAEGPAVGQNWDATVDNTGSAHTIAGLAGFATPAEIPLACCGWLLVNVADPGGELLQVAPKLGSGLVAFSLAVPMDLALLGVSLSTQGYGYGGGVTLYNAYDLVVGY
ncbi:MAG: VCBS repeat-containing protein [Planctomycetota bacterium]